MLEAVIEDRGWYTIYETYTARTLTWPDKYNYLRSRYDLGLGWSFAFPSVQIENESGKQYIHFHDGTGGTYKANFTPDTADSNLENYQGKDIQFNEDSGTYSNGQVSSKYVLIGSDQRKSYFAADGRLLGIKDRFGNEIKFSHIDRMIHGKSYPFISQITDSIGRTIDFQYENTLNQSTSENLTLTIKDPSKTESLTINYNKQRVVAAREDTGETYYEPRLYRVTDPEGYETTYGYEFDGSKSRFLFNKKDLTQSAYTRLALLTTIYYPHSKSSYVYETVQRNLGPEGAYDGYRIKVRFDQELRYNPSNNEAVGAGDFNHVNYQYFKLNSTGAIEYNKGDYTGYPEYYSEDSLPESYQYGSESTILSSGLKTRSIFNGKK